MASPGISEGSDLYPSAAYSAIRPNAGHKEGMYPVNQSSFVLNQRTLGLDVQHCHPDFEAEFLGLGQMLLLFSVKLVYFYQDFSPRATMEF